MLAKEWGGGGERCTHVLHERKVSTALASRRCAAAVSPMSNRCRHHRPGASRTSRGAPSPPSRAGVCPTRRATVARCISTGGPAVITSALVGEVDCRAADGAVKHVTAIYVGKAVEQAVFKLSAIRRSWGDGAGGGAGWGARPPAWAVAQLRAAGGR